MKSASQACRNYKPADKRTLALALLLCFIVVSLLSEAVLLTHAGHVHDHNGAGGACAACVRMQTAENILKLPGAAAVGGFTLFAGCYAAAALVGAGYSDTAVLTPITAKARMDN